MKLLASVALVLALAGPAHAAPCTTPPAAHNIWPDRDLSDYGPGNVGLIIGHSGAVRLGQAIRQTDDVRWIIGAQPGHDSQQWANDADVFDQALDKLNGLTPADVDVVVIHLSTRSDSDAEGWADQWTYLHDMLIITGRVDALFPNVSRIYVSARVGAEFVTGPRNGEPGAWRFGVAAKHFVRWMQRTDDRFVFGPYLWTSSVCPRRDGVLFTEADYTDPTHLDPAAIARELIRAG